MKKIYLITLSIFSFCQINAQTYTLTQSNTQPVVGDTYGSVTLDTANTPLPISISGSNVTWLVMDVVQTPTTTIAVNTYSTALSNTNSVNYPGTNLVLADSTTTTFYKTTTNKLELLGVDAGFFDLNYNTASATLANYPMAYGSTFVDNTVSGTMNIPSQALSGPFTGTVTTTVDGSGTLNINNNASIFTNCLRVKTNQFIDFNLSGGFLSGTIDQTIYNFYNSSSKIPVFTISYSHIIVPLASIDQVQAQVSTLATVVIGVKENQKISNLFSVFPNPANAQLNLHFVLANNDSYTFEISNTLGQVVKTISMLNLQAGLYNESVNTSDLTAGIYTVKVTGKNSHGTQKLIIQK